MLTYLDECDTLFFLTDIDECASQTPACDVNALCVNEIGSFQCVCHTGYEGDGLYCTGELTICVSHDNYYSSTNKRLTVSTHTYVFSTVMLGK